MQNFNENITVEHLETAIAQSELPVSSGTSQLISSVSEEKLQLLNTVCAPYKWDDFLGCRLRNDIAEVLKIGRCEAAELQHYAMIKLEVVTKDVRPQLGRSLSLGTSGLR